MNITCPNCHSEHVIRVVNPHSQTGNQSLASSASFATMGAALSKSLPISPLIGGIAGAVVGGIFNSLFDRVPVTPSYCFQCQSCGQLFY
ncbi:TPA: hypothetical protein JIZ13_13970 [Acinetobacter nosocomialis]|uniref:hypothetical protein n=1 Tax=Acinetobacter baumannii TaxID=470 RepID=UPI00056F177B|nr:hypothetical protein [Acinetobacter baumannii]HAV4990421.1 hypothetical protein [Acinetobacter nosocomialis]EKT9038635.1 hypothetical protein [Acinetobacter baumannii]EKU1483919.1 hypothetical protein [Acinetobacter baumannii]EKU5668892.1 hypothetical protein [Acinetobacter baumannii]EKU6934460.1 hypothetical protein [Acinetobacter baumannii]